MLAEERAGGARRSRQSALANACIVVGVDGSDAAPGAAKVAAQLARRLHDSMVLACVVPPPPIGDPAILDPLQVNIAEAQFASAESMLQKSVAELGTEVPVQTRVLTGQPAAALEELARHDDVELVVVGSHGLSPVGRALLGSVASRLIRTCRKPVMVVPAPAWRSGTVYKAEACL